MARHRLQVSRPAFGYSLAGRIGSSSGPITTVSNLSQLQTAVAALGTVPGGIIAVTSSIDGGATQLTVQLNGLLGRPITITRNPGVLLTNFTQIYTTGSYVRFLDLDVGSNTIDGIKFTDNANHCEIDHCRIHANARMGVNVQPGAGNPSDIQIWNNEIFLNGTDPTLDHGIYYAVARGNSIVCNNLLYNNKAYNIQLYPDAPGIFAGFNTMDGGATRGGMVVGSGTGLTDNVTLVGNIGTNAAYYVVDVFDPGAGDTNNLCYDSLGFGNALGDFNPGGGFTYTNCSVADPKYVDRPGGNYRLLGGSPAIGKIQAARYGFVPPTDRDGRVRITADAGCYAY